MVEQVQHALLETPVTVYNFEVADFHTYYVGDTEVLVQNTCNTGTGDAPPMQKPNSTYHKINNNGDIRSIAYYDCDGRQIMRLDYDHAHANTQPHIHVLGITLTGRSTINRE